MMGCGTHVIRRGVCPLLLAACHAAAVAQSHSTGSGHAYPVKPIRLMVPFPPGAGADVVARTLAQKVAEALGVQVVVDNRARREAS